MDNADSTPARLSVHVDRDDNPVVEMSESERMRLFVRILCELVAYDEAETESTEHETATRATGRPVPAHRRSRVTPGR